MAELVDVAEQDIKTLTEIGKEVLPAARRVLNNRDYQEAAEKAAPVVKNLVAGLLAESKSGVDTLQNIPVALQKKIDAMRAVTADTFRRDNPRARARADWLDLWPLLNRGEPLRGLPERIAKLEKEIAEAVVVWAGRETTGGWASSLG